MRFHATVLAFAASLAMVSAQDLSKLPACALPCLIAALPASGCSATDTKCQCTTGQAAIAASLGPCAQQKCSPADQATLATQAAALCASAGVSVAAASPSAAAAAASSAVSSALASVSASISSVQASSTRTAPATTATGAATGNMAGLAAVALGFVVAL